MFLIGSVEAIDKQNELLWIIELPPNNQWASIEFFELDVLFLCSKEGTILTLNTESQVLYLFSSLCERKQIPSCHHLQFDFFFVLIQIFILFSHKEKTLHVYYYSHYYYYYYRYYYHYYYHYYYFKMYFR